MNVPRTAPRIGAVNLFLVLLLVSAIVLGALVALLVWKPRENVTVTSNGQPDSKSAGEHELFLYCAAGLRYPIDQIAGRYADEYGIRVRTQYGGSNTLLSQLQVSRSGDLYLAADDSYLQLARNQGLVAEVLPLASMRPIVALRSDSKHEIKSIQDLLQPGLKIGCGNPDAAAIGKRVQALLSKTGQWEELERRITEDGVFKPTVNDVANDVKLGAVDAGIVWDATAAQYPELKVVRLPELDAGAAQVEIGVLASAADPTAALRFARYVAARDRGLETFAEMHFPVMEGDVWSEQPELTFFAGSVNRRALDPIIKAFALREGAQINTVYNGCGILTGQMKAIAHNQESGFPDTYMACDVYYMDTVSDWFEDKAQVSNTDIVIAVRKGNPKHIRQLKDLLQPGVRVVIGQPDQCTIGVLTRRLLEHEGLYDQLLKENVVAQTSSSAMLVPAITTGSADAVLAYQTDTLAEQDKVDTVRIDSSLAKAIQPFGIAKTSRHKYLARRLFDTIAHSRAAFESVGFGWCLQPDAEQPLAAPPALPADRASSDRKPVP